MVNIMKFLYHGSGYKHSELKPGIHHTGKLQRWDNTESNEWLYATTMREEAIAQGLASVIEKNWSLTRFQSTDRSIVIYIDGKVPTYADIVKLTVYLYVIQWDDAHWTKVDNVSNGMESEYKTKTTIPSSLIASCEPVDLTKWLRGKTLTIKQNPNAMAW